MGGNTRLNPRDIWLCIQLGVRYRKFVVSSPASEGDLYISVAFAYTQPRPTHYIATAQVHNITLDTPPLTHHRKNEMDMDPLAIAGGRPAVLPPRVPVRCDPDMHQPPWCCAHLRALRPGATTGRSSWGSPSPSMMTQTHGHRLRSPSLRRHNISRFTYYDRFICL